MNKNWIWIVVVLVVAVLLWWWFGTGMMSDDLMNGEEEVAVLSAVGNFVGSGEATRDYSDGEFSHAVSANLDVPAVGFFYEGWLVKQLPPTFISTGKLEAVSDGMYTLEFVSAEDYSNYNRVVITQETASLGLDNNPEEHVLEGSF